MASTYSDLKIELIGTGEQSGTWGTTTNTNLGTAIEEAITGSVDVSFSSADVTLTLTDTNTTQSARNLRLNLTGTSGGARILTVPAIEKIYIVNNGLADACTVTASGGTGIAVPAGKTMYLYIDGTNTVDAITHLTSLTLATDLAVADGGTGASTASDARTNLGVAIGSNVQAYNSGLADISALAKTDGNIIVGDGSNWVAESGATARASLGLTIGTNVQAYDADLTAIGALAKTDGNFIVGNGTTWVAESGATARTSLGLGTLATLNEVNAATIADNSVGADELNVSGDGTSGQALLSDGDGSFSWGTQVSLGVGQTWQDVTASRSAGTTYTNSTGKPIFISASWYGAPNQGCMELYINGTLIGRQGVVSVASAGMYSTMTAVIPNGVTYKADTFIGGSLQSWFELR